jgi:hypothetical protein
MTTRRTMVHMVLLAVALHCLSMCSLYHVSCLVMCYRLSYRLVPLIGRALID